MRNAERGFILVDRSDTGSIAESRRSSRAIPRQAITLRFFVAIRLECVQRNSAGIGRAV